MPPGGSWCVRPSAGQVLDAYRIPLYLHESGGQPRGGVQARIFHREALNRDTRLPPWRVQGVRYGPTVHAVRTPSKGDDPGKIIAFPYWVRRMTRREHHLPGSVDIVHGQLTNELKRKIH